MYSLNISFELQLQNSWISDFKCQGFFLTVIFHLIQGERICHWRLVICPICFRTEIRLLTRIYIGRYTEFVIGTIIVTETSFKQRPTRLTTLIEEKEPSCVKLTSSFSVCLFHELEGPRVVEFPWNIPYNENGHIPDMTYMSISIACYCLPVYVRLGHITFILVTSPVMYYRPML